MGCVGLEFRNDYIMFKAKHVVLVLGLVVAYTFKSYPCPCKIICIFFSIPHTCFILEAPLNIVMQSFFSVCSVLKKNKVILEL